MNNFTICWIFLLPLFVYIGWRFATFLGVVLIRQTIGFPPPPESDRVLEKTWHVRIPRFLLSVMIGVGSGAAGGTLAMFLWGAPDLIFHAGNRPDWTMFSTLIFWGDDWGTILGGMLGLGFGCAPDAIALEIGKTYRDRFKAYPRTASFVVSGALILAVVVYFMRYSIYDIVDDGTGLGSDPSWIPTFPFMGAAIGILVGGMAGYLIENGLRLPSWKSKTRTYP